MEHNKQQRHTNARERAHRASHSNHEQNDIEKNNVDEQFKTARTGTRCKESCTRASTQSLLMTAVFLFYSALACTHTYTQYLGKKLTWLFEHQTCFRISNNIFFLIDFWKHNSSTWDCNLISIHMLPAYCIALHVAIMTFQPPSSVKSFSVSTTHTPLQAQQTVLWLTVLLPLWFQLNKNSLQEKKRSGFVFVS